MIRAQLVVATLLAAPLLAGCKLATTTEYPGTKPTVIVGYGPVQTTASKPSKEQALAKPKTKTAEQPRPQYKPPQDKSICVGAWCSCDTE